LGADVRHQHHEPVQRGRCHLLQGVDELHTRLYAASPRPVTWQHGVMALPPLDDTIAAIATATGTGAIGIVRLSGPATYQVADRMFQSSKGSKPSTLAPGRAVYGAVSDGVDLIDEALLLTF